MKEGGRVAVNGGGGGDSDAGDEEVSCRSKTSDRPRNPQQPHQPRPHDDGINFLFLARRGGGGGPANS